VPVMTVTVTVKQMKLLSELMVTAVPLFLELKKMKMRKTVINHIKDFSGYIVASGSACCKNFNNMVVERTIRKAFPDDLCSTLYIVKVKGVKAYLALYEDEMIKVK
jgi:hypothetical protein